MDVHFLLANASSVDDLQTFHLRVALRCNLIETRRQTSYYTAFDDGLEEARKAAQEIDGITLERVVPGDEEEEYQLEVDGKAPRWSEQLQDKVR